MWVIYNEQKDWYISRLKCIQLTSNLPQSPGVKMVYDKWDPCDFIDSDSRGVASPRSARASFSPYMDRAARKSISHYSPVPTGRQDRSFSVAVGGSGGARHISFSKHSEPHRIIRELRKPSVAQRRVSSFTGTRRVSTASCHRGIHHRDVRSFTIHEAMSRASSRKQNNLSNSKNSLLSDSKKEIIPDVESKKRDSTRSLAGSKRKLNGSIQSFVSLKSKRSNHASDQSLNLNDSNRSLDGPKSVLRKSPNGSAQSLTPLLHNGELVDDADAKSGGFGGRDVLIIDDLTKIKGEIQHKSVPAWACVMCMWLWPLIPVAISKHIFTQIILSYCI